MGKNILGFNTNLLGGIVGDKITKEQRKVLRSRNWDDRFMDVDKDGVIDGLDCAPRNRLMHGITAVNQNLERFPQIKPSMPNRRVIVRPSPVKGVPKPPYPRKGQPDVKLPVEPRKGTIRLPPGNVKIMPVAPAKGTPKRPMPRKGIGVDLGKWENQDKLRGM